MAAVEGGWLQWREGGRLQWREGGRLWWRESRGWMAVVEGRLRVDGCGGGWVAAVL